MHVNIKKIAINRIEVGQMEVLREIINCTSAQLANSDLILSQLRFPPKISTRIAIGNANKIEDRQYQN